MLVEIRKAGFINKGAQLMLYATLQKMKSAYPDAQFAMAPTAANGSAPFKNRAECGILQKAWLWRYGMNWGSLAALMPYNIREMYGVVLDKEIDIVLDMAGFAYSDQWGINSCRELALSCRRWRKQGTKVILLPQAFGPFNAGENREWIEMVAEMADLIFTRDPISYQYLAEVVGVRPNIRMAPDFTNLLEGMLPDGFDVQNNQFCIVPNYRMIDKTPKNRGEAYLPFMITCAQYLLQKKAKPFILVHEGTKDLMLAKKICEGAGGGLPIIQENHPLKIKGILGVCKGTLGSRFHGLVSALSQGVPSLASGWSHKYKMLFDEYGFTEGLLDVLEREPIIQKKIDLVTEYTSHEQIQSELIFKSAELRKKSEKMWLDVFGVIG